MNIDWSNHEGSNKYATPERCSTYAGFASTWASRQRKMKMNDNK